jgi:hypothetical protein
MQRLISLNLSIIKTGNKTLIRHGADPLTEAVVRSVLSLSLFSEANSWKIAIYLSCTFTPCRTQVIKFNKVHTEIYSKGFKKPSFLTYTWQYKK